MSTEMVPFGKHKGKPVDALLDDRPYLDWLLAQPWFKEKFGNVYNIVINNGTEPTETPEHNAMQIRFMAEEFRLKFTHAIGLVSVKNTTELAFEVDGIDAQFWTTGSRFICVEVKPTIGDDYPATLRQIKRYKEIRGATKEYFRADFCLLLRTYTGIGATESQFREFFKSQGITVVFEHEVDAVVLPAFDREISQEGK